MKKSLALLGLAIALALTACNKGTPAVYSPIKGEKGDKGDPGTVVEVTPKPSPLTDVELVVQNENEYREILGQAPLTKGLTCTLYTVPNGSSGITGTTLTSVSSYGYKGKFNQPDSNVSAGLNILPPALRPIYTSWYVVRCTGKIVTTISDYYFFDLASDDGSILYLDGTNVINNDGNHGVQSKVGMKFLREGVHDFRIDYMQGPAGNQALILKMDGSILSNEVLFH